MFEIVIISAILTLFGGFLYGLYVGNYKVFPFQVIEKIYLRVKSNKSDKRTTMPNIYETNVKSLIRINNEEDIRVKRKAIINYLWGENGFPHNKMPNSVEDEIIDQRYNDVKNLKRINKLTISMEYNMAAVVYFFEAEKKNNKLIIYHEGHHGDFINEKNTIRFFVEKGYCMLGISMPLLGMNSQPTVEFSEFGKIKLQFHNQLHLLDTTNFHPLKYYFEPVAVSLNYADSQFKFSHHYMIGLSGGGWTTVVYPAIDERISHGYSVAGANPIFLRLDNTDYFDYEHTVPEFYRIANYEELYVMSSYGKGRKLVQIFNKYDTCCFANDFYKIYENDIKNKLSDLGEGQFENYLDDTYKGHKISDYALKIINSSLEKN